MNVTETPADFDLCPACERNRLRRPDVELCPDCEEWLDAAVALRVEEARAATYADDAARFLVGDDEGELCARGIRC